MSSIRRIASTIFRRKASTPNLKPNHDATSHGVAPALKMRSSSLETIRPSHPSNAGTIQPQEVEAIAAEMDTIQLQEAENVETITITLWDVETVEWRGQFLPPPLEEGEQVIFDEGGQIWTTKHWWILTDRGWYDQNTWLEDGLREMERLGWPDVKLVERNSTSA